MPAGSEVDASINYADYYYRWVLLIPTEKGLIIVRVTFCHLLDSFQQFDFAFLEKSCP